MPKKHIPVIHAGVKQQAHHIRTHIANGRFTISDHARMRMVERDLTLDDVTAAVANGIVCEASSPDPATLRVFFYNENGVVVLVGSPMGDHNAQASIITVYIDNEATDWSAPAPTVMTKPSSKVDLDTLPIEQLDDMIERLVNVRKQRVSEYQQKREALIRERDDLIEKAAALDEQINAMPVYE